MIELYEDGIARVQLVGKGGRDLEKCRTSTMMIAVVGPIRWTEVNAAGSEELILENQRVTFLGC